MRRLLIALRRRSVWLGFALGSRLPIRRRIVLATSHAEHLAGNLSWLADTLAARDPAPPVVVLAFRHRGGLGRFLALWQAVRSGYHLATARVFVVDDYFFAMYVIRPRPGTRRIQVWHAAGAFKRFGYSVLDKTFGADEEMIARVPIHANYDLCLVSSRAAVPHYAEAFRQPPDRFTSRLGIPRTDLFFDPERRAQAVERVRRRYGLPDGRRVVLHAPTFRGVNVRAARDPGLLDLDVMHEELGDDHLVLLRMHPFVRGRVALAPGLEGFVVDASDHPDMNELLLVADVLVTDYSSVVFEYALLRRPMGFFAPDLESYELERGFYFDYRSGVPGPVFTSTRELARWLRDGPVEPDRIEAFARTWFDVADGRATARLVDEVLLPALDGQWTGPAGVAGAPSAP